jgi:lipopolysaccharide-induced tumor necrosis factor-alpha factor
VLVRTVLTRHRTYLTRCVTAKGDPAQDPELMAMLDSFRFTSPPIAPEVRAGRPKFDARKLGEAMGQDFMLLGVAVGVVVLLIKIQNKKPARIKGAPDVICPACGHQAPPLGKKSIKPVGWVVFAVLLLACLPLCWLPFVLDSCQREERSCEGCGTNLGGESSGEQRPGPPS